MAQLHNLTIDLLPIDLPAEPVSMLYRRVDHADSRASWFRALFVEVAGAALEASGCKMGISRIAA